MKRILTLTLVFLLSAFLPTASASPDAKTIKSSKLITQEDAGRILGVDSATLNAKKIDEIKPTKPWAIQTLYDKFGVAGFLSITLYQDAQLDMSKTASKGWMQSGGAAGYGKLVRKNDEKNEKEIVISVEGIGDWAYLNGKGLSSDSTISTTNMYIAYGKYFIFLQKNGLPPGNKFSEKEKIEWNKKVITEAGKLAVERLKALTK